jgi:hypothetical protein
MNFQEREKQISETLETFKNNFLSVEKGFDPFQENLDIYNQLDDFLKHNTNITTYLLAHTHKYWKEFPESVTKNDERIISMLQKDARVFFYLDEHQKLNPDIVKVALKRDGNLLKEVDKQFKNNINLVKIAVENNPFAFLYVPKKFLRFPEKLLMISGFTNFLLHASTEPHDHIDYLKSHLIQNKNKEFGFYLEKEFLNTWGKILDNMDGKMDKGVFLAPALQEYVTPFLNNWSIKTLEALVSTLESRNFVYQNIKKPLQAMFTHELNRKHIVAVRLDTNLDKTVVKKYRKLKF